MIRIGRYVVLTVVTALFLVSNGTADAQNKSLLPADVTIENEYQAGNAAPVGKVLQTEGPAYILHADQNIAYRAAAGLFLYANDMLVTDPEGRLRFQLADESEITIAPSTRLTIDRSIFDPDKKERSIYLRMNLGKTRLLIRKLFDFKHSSVKLKTRTAIAGVRGSHFFVEAFINRTVITTDAKTQVESLCQADPDKEPIVLGSFQQIVVPEGQCPSPEDVTKALPPKQIQEQNQLFEFTQPLIISQTEEPIGSDKTPELRYEPATTDMLDLPPLIDLPDQPRTWPDAEPWINRSIETIDQTRHDENVRGGGGGDLPPPPGPPN